MKLQTIIISTILSVAFFMSGCVSKSIQVDNSGFFKDYEKFEKSNDSTRKISSLSDMSVYKNIIISPVQVISGIPLDKQTPSQKILYKEISEYLTSEYKKEIQKANRYVLTDIKGPNTLKLESAISAVEVHYDDEKWNQFSPVSIGVTVVSYNSYMDENVRILGEKRLVDSQSTELLSAEMSIQKNKKIIMKQEYLKFEDIKPSLDSWLGELKKDFSK